MCGMTSCLQIWKKVSILMKFKFEKEIINNCDYMYYKIWKGKLKQP